MDRLFGVFSDDESLYDIRRTDPGDPVADFELGFCDMAAGPYEALVLETVDVLAAVPGVVDVWQEDREVLLVRAPGVETIRLAEVVDRFWLDALTRTEPDPAYDDELGSPDPPDLARAWSPEPVPEGPLPSARDALRPAPSARRMWTYLGCGAVATAGGLVLALTPGGGSGVMPLVLGVVNLAVGLDIARRRRGLPR
ncbi:hypothetical protein [Cellulomonas sp. URHB0016]